MLKTNIKKTFTSMLNIQQDMTANLIEKYEDIIAEKNEIIQEQSEIIEKQKEYILELLNNIEKKPFFNLSALRSKLASIIF